MKRNEKGQFVKGNIKVDITGRRYGKLVAIELDCSKNARKPYWICKCDCGNIKSIRKDCLGKVKSCGCLKKEQDLKNFSIDNNHGKTKHPAFSIWDAMMNRCHNPKTSAYKDYGERGISVCEEWRDVSNFCDWMDSNAFAKGLTIERVDVNGNYSPENCTLVPQCQQAWNTRKTVYAEIEGKVIPLAKTARELGLEPCLVWHRWKRGVREHDKLFFKGNLRHEYG